MVSVFKKVEHDGGDSLKTAWVEESAGALLAFTQY